MDKKQYFFHFTVASNTIVFLHGIADITLASERTLGVDTCADSTDIRIFTFIDI